MFATLYKAHDLLRRARRGQELLIPNPDFVADTKGWACGSMKVEEFWIDLTRPT